MMRSFLWFLFSPPTHAIDLLENSTSKIISKSIDSNDAISVSNLPYSWKISLIWRRISISQMNRESSWEHIRILGVFSERKVIILYFLHGWIPNNIRCSHCELRESVWKIPFLRSAPYTPPYQRGGSNIHFFSHQPISLAIQNPILLPKRREYFLELSESMEASVIVHLQIYSLSGTMENWYIWGGIIIKLLFFRVQ